MADVCTPYIYRCILLCRSIFGLVLLGCGGWSCRKEAHHYIFSRFSVSTINLKRIINYGCSFLNINSVTQKNGTFFDFRVVFNTLFGLSVQYWMAITTRLLLGALNGMLAPIKVGTLIRLGCKGMPWQLVSNYKYKQVCLWLVSFFFAGLLNRDLSTWAPCSWVISCK